MNGMKHGGNVFPSRLPAHVQEGCVAAFHKLQEVLSNQVATFCFIKANFNTQLYGNLLMCWKPETRKTRTPRLPAQRGFYGVDFVIEDGTLDPVLVDLNMGRPNGNHYFQLFRDSLPVRPPAWSGRRANFDRASELGLDGGFAAVMQKLRDAGIALDFASGVGVGMVQVAVDRGRDRFVAKVFAGARSAGELDAINATLDHMIRESETKQGNDAGPSFKLDC
jgi:hypothetical protein